MELQLASPPTQLSRDWRTVDVPGVRARHDRRGHGRVRRCRTSGKRLRFRRPRFPCIRYLVRAILPQPGGGCIEGKTDARDDLGLLEGRSEEHTSELQSLTNL